MMGIGGCIRDHVENWILGYAKYMGIGTVLQAKLWSILIGL